MEAVGQETGSFPPVRERGYEVALGVLPFFIVGLATLFMKLPWGATAPSWSTVLVGLFFFGGYLLTLLGLLAGWLAGFPRWAYPYLVYGCVFSLFLTNASTPGLSLFGVQLWGRQLWGWRAFVPLGFIVLLALLFSRPIWGNLLRLVRGVWQDWTRLVFGLYGLMPFMVLIIMDEVHVSLPNLLAISLGIILVVAGAFLYMRLPSQRSRALGLLGCAFLAGWVSAFGSELYWQTHSINFTTGEIRLLEGPLPLGSILPRSLLLAGFMLLVLLLPGLIGLTHALVDFLRPPGVKAA